MTTSKEIEYDRGVTMYVCYANPSNQFFLSIWVSELFAIAEVRFLHESSLCYFNWSLSLEDVKQIWLVRKSQPLNMFYISIIFINLIFILIIFRFQSLAGHGKTLWQLRGLAWPGEDWRSKQLKTHIWNENPKLELKIQTQLNIIWYL